MGKEGKQPSFEVVSSTLMMAVPELPKAGSLPFPQQRMGRNSCCQRFTSFVTHHLSSNKFPLNYLKRAGSEG